MKKYPVGSVCVLVEPTYQPYLGKECTIVSAYGLHKTKNYGEQDGYMVVVQGFGEQRFFSFHHGLKIKKLPPDEAFEAFLNKLTQPVEELACA